MFRGPSSVLLDAKNRLAIPTRFREEIITRCEGRMIVTVNRPRCLLLFPMPEWEVLERQLMRLPSMKKRERKVRRSLLGMAAEIEMDGHGRILLPAAHRRFAGLEREVALVGQGNMFEIWDEQRWFESTDQWLDEADGDDGDDDGAPSEALESLVF